MRLHLVPWMLILLLTPTPFARALDKDALRKSATMPSGSVTISIELQTDGFHLRHENEPAATARRIKALLAEMTGSPDDAERYDLLANLYKDSALVDKAVQQAARLYLQRLKLRPDDGYLFAQLGQCSSDLGLIDEAEALLRRGVALGPGDWRTWTALGQFLTAREWQVLLGRILRDWAKINRLGPLPKPDDERLQRARALSRESRNCFDKAVELAPHEPTVYRIRARCCGKLRAAMGWALEKATTDFFVNPDNADLEKLVELDPKNSRTILGSAIYSWMAKLLTLTKASPRLSEDEIWAKQLKPIYERARARLIPLTKVKDPKIAGQAAEYMGLLCELFAAGVDKTIDPVPWYRLAIQIDPARDVACLSLCDKLWNADRVDEAISLCRMRLKLGKSAPVSYLLSMTLVDEKRLAEAEKELRAALQCDSAHLRCRVGLAVVLIRKGDAASLQEASAELRRAEKLVNDDTPADLRSHLPTTAAIVAALEGKTDAARDMLRKVLDDNPDFEAATGVLKVLYDLPEGPPGETASSDVPKQFQLPPLPGAAALAPPPADSLAPEAPDGVEAPTGLPDVDSILPAAAKKLLKPGSR